VNLDNLSNLETLLTSVLTTLGVSSPLLVSAVRFAFREYHKLSNAAALIEAYDSRFEELDLRLKQAGIKDPDQVVTREIRRLRGSLKESFARRDLRLSQMETRVEVIRHETLAKPQPAQPVHVPEDVTILKAKSIEQSKVVNLVKNEVKTLSYAIDELKVNQADLEQRVVGQAAPKPITGTHDMEAKLKELETQNLILKRALIKLAGRIKVDLSFELHEPSSNIEKQPAKTAAPSNTK